MPYSPEQITTLRSGFLANYGSFLALWSTFDITVEVLLMRQLRLSPEEASIVFAGAGFGAKLNVLYSLLNRDKSNSAGVRFLKEAHRIAERNTFAHGFFRLGKEDPTFSLIKREVKESYEVKMRVFDFDAMDRHLESFENAYIAFKNHFGITNPDLDAYTKLIEAHAQAKVSRGKPRPEFTPVPAHTRKPRPPRRR